MSKQFRSSAHTNWVRLRGSAAAAILAALLVGVAGASGEAVPGSGRIVFITNPYCKSEYSDCGRGEVASVRPDGTGLKTLTHNRVTESTPVWSPSGGQIAFSRPQGGGQVWLMDADGHNQRQLTHLPRDHFFGDLDWAPSGRTLVIKAFTATDPPTNIELWLVDVSSRKAKRLTHTPLDEAAPAWSPNGRWIAYSTEGRRRPYRIRRLTISTGKVVELTAGRSAAAWPSWSPDSRQIAFTMAGRIGIMDANGSHRRLLRVNGARPHWSPDGRWIVYSLNADLYRVRPDGRGRFQITHRANRRVVDDQPDW